MSDIVYQPNPDIADRAHIGSMESYQALYDKSVQSPSQFWDKQAGRITFFYPYTTVFEEDFEKPAIAWFEGGRLNACYNCVDRHLEERGDQTAIIWAGDEPGHYQHISYTELRDQVCRLANALIQCGVRKGDRVCFYMPMIPELAYGMLACARIGAIHSVVFAGFSADSLRDRIIDADCRAVLTANEGLRGGKTIPLKQTVDTAIDGLPVHTVLVKRRTDTAVPMRQGLLVARKEPETR